MFPIAKRIDKIIFLFINHDSDSILFDPIMIALRNSYTWIPLYAFILWYSFSRIRENAIHLILLSLVVVTLTDLTSYRLLKPFFERPRPCNDPELMGLVRVLVDCGRSYSFPSNHAANHFGLATLWFLYIKNVTARSWHWLWAWAGIICYSQIYVGKHFPSDIIGGAFLNNYRPAGVQRTSIYSLALFQAKHKGKRLVQLKLIIMTDPDKLFDSISFAHIRQEDIKK